MAIIVRTFAEFTKAQPARQSPAVARRLWDIACGKFVELCGQQRIEAHANQDSAWLTEDADILVFQRAQRFWQAATDYAKRLPLG